MMEKREAERKAYKEKTMAEWKADIKRRKADFEKKMARGNSTEKWLQSWKPFMTRQTPMR
jgi:phage regulator Rha-like protein